MSKEPFMRFDALKFARRLLVEGAVVLKQHAKDRMKERRLATTDIENIIIETPRMGLAVAFRCDEAGDVHELVIVSVWRKS